MSDNNNLNTSISEQNQHTDAQSTQSSDMLDITSLGRSVAYLDFDKNTVCTSWGSRARHSRYRLWLR